MLFSNAGSQPNGGLAPCENKKSIIFKSFCQEYLDFKDLYYASHGTM